MKSPLLISLAALVLSGVCLVATVMVASSTEARRVAAGSPVAIEPGIDLDSRVEKLAEENRELRKRLASLEIRPAPTQRAPDMGRFVTRDEFEAFRREVLDSRNLSQEIARAPAETQTLVLEQFREHVASALIDVRKQQAAVKLRALDVRTEGLDESVAKLTSWLELSPDQSDRMRSTLLARYDREADILRRWREGVDSEVLGELKRNDREVHNIELAEFLTPEQLETYTSRSDGK